MLKFVVVFSSAFQNVEDAIKATFTISGLSVLRIEGVSFKRNSGAASVGGYNEVI